MPYLAIINVPGYLPMDDEPPVFDTAQEAWDYLAGERERGEDYLDDEDYSATHLILATLGTSAHWQLRDAMAYLREHGLADNGTGTIYGPTPGYEGEHDLGLAYTVTLVDENGVPK